MMCKVRRDRRRTLTVCRRRCLLLWTLSGERAVANHWGTARRAVCELLSNTNLLMCTTLNEQQPLTFGDVYGRVQDLTTPVTLTTRCLVQFICCERVLTMCNESPWLIATLNLYVETRIAEDVRSYIGCTFFPTLGRAQPLRLGG